MNNEDKGYSRKKWCSFPAIHREKKQTLKKDKYKGKSIYSGYRCHLNKVKVFILAVTKQTPGESREEIGQNVFKRNPEEWNEEKNEFWE